MTRIVFALVLGFSILAITGCGTDVQDRHDEIMKIHDEVMPRMGEMHQLRLDLEQAMAGKDSLQRLPYLEAIRELRKGEDMMWAWMNDYKKPVSATPESLQYLEEQQVAVAEVADQMNRAIEYSIALLP